jgi:DnaJ family protein C protein 28
MGEPPQKKDWESLIDQQIREALQRGEFDDLPGKGHPLDLAPNPYAPEQELAFKILKDAGYAPEWIELDKAIRAKTEAARATLARSWERYQARLAQLQGRSDAWAQSERQRAAVSWRRAIVAFEEQIVSVNEEITELNLKVPSSRFQRPKLDAAREVAKLDTGLDTAP